jgi:hypothetical protein
MNLSLGESSIVGRNSRNSGLKAHARAPGAGKRLAQISDIQPMRRLGFVISALLLVALGSTARLMAEGQEGSFEANAGPTVVVIGHDLVTVFGPFFTSAPVCDSSRARCESPHENPSQASSPGSQFGRFMADPTRRFVNDGWITPTGVPAAQPARR